MIGVHHQLGQQGSHENDLIVDDIVKPLSKIPGSGPSIQQLVCCRQDLMPQGTCPGLQAAPTSGLCQSCSIYDYLIRQHLK